MESIKEFEYGQMTGYLKPMLIEREVDGPPL